MDSLAKIRRQQLKEVLAKQAELGVKVAFIPSIYLTKPEDQSSKIANPDEALNTNIETPCKHFANKKRGWLSLNKRNAKRLKLKNVTPLLTKPEDQSSKIANPDEALNTNIETPCKHFTNKKRSRLRLNKRNSKRLKLENVTPLLAKPEDQSSKIANPDEALNTNIETPCKHFTNKKRSRLRLNKRNSKRLKLENVTPLLAKPEDQSSKIANPDEALNTNIETPCKHFTNKKRSRFRCNKRNAKRLRACLVPIFWVRRLGCGAAFCREISAATLFGRRFRGNVPRSLGESGPRDKLRCPAALPRFIERLLPRRPSLLAIDPLLSQNSHGVDVRPYFAKQGGLSLLCSSHLHSISHGSLFHEKS
ncbi:uncharacterized protein LOC110035967 [Phalaenopsis equestris]|uniref:uncharacterized protein LOC110035967 n=1 Tax=Phalaenopsis equestris TaxID=78828 RepID=UPI0009E3D759|nr:uncharacterized protein LOC110035967 [Phalaenopsis equestris]